MTTQPSADAVAIAASNLVVATIQAHASAGLLHLSGDEGPQEIEKLFTKMVNIVQREFAAEGAGKSRMKVFGE